jgi:hypothetical protein
MRPEPIDLINWATVTSALTILGLKAYEGVISEATKDLWGSIKSKFHWKNDPPKELLAMEIAIALKDNDVLVREVVELLKAKPDAGGDSAALVGHIQATNVVVAHTIITKNFNM